MGRNFVETAQPLALVHPHFFRQIMDSDSHGPGSLTPRSPDATNNSPIIAVLAQDITFNGHLTTYIAASYIKYIESSGGRVVPILTSFDSSTIEFLFTCVNGVLIPGGGADLPGSKVYENAKIFYDLALKSNKNGDYFPIWGTCMGFEALPIITAGTTDVMTACKSLDISLPLDLTPLADKSRLFRHMSPTLRSAITSEKITYNWHDFGFKPEIFEINCELKNFYNVLSTSTDEDGGTFVSTYEAKEFPFYAVMWHPEKNKFEFKWKNIPHTPNAIKVSQYMANFFVGEARKSHHKFSSTGDEEKYLIYHYQAVRLDNPVFEQVYIFK